MLTVTRTQYGLHQDAFEKFRCERIAHQVEVLCLLKENNVGISMSRQSTPWDNAACACESLVQTLQYREVLRTGYRHLHEAQFVDPRPPGGDLQRPTVSLALGYLPAAEFEAKLARVYKDAVALRFSV
jgi:hypothetical protein